MSSVQRQKDKLLLVSAPGVWGAGFQGIKCRITTCNCTEAVPAIPGAWNCTNMMQEMVWPCRAKKTGKKEKHFFFPLICGSYGLKRLNNYIQPLDTEAWNSVPGWEHSCWARLSLDEHTGAAQRPELRKGRAVSGRGSQATFSAGQRGGSVEGQPQHGSGGG